MRRSRLRRAAATAIAVAAAVLAAPSGPRVAAAAVSDPITFSEFPNGTSITDQYLPQGVRFLSDVFITSDSSQPTTPVLSGTPRFVGDVRARFTVPGTAQDATVDGFSIDVGYIDTRDSTVVEYFDASGAIVGRVVAQNFAVNHLSIAYRGVAGFVVRSIADEPAGFSVDNLRIVRGAEGAVVRRMASLGDSYTSGEGLVPGPDGLRYDCATDLHQDLYWRDTTMPLRFRFWLNGVDCDTRTGSTSFAPEVLLRGFAKHENTCHRHARAYPVQIGGKLGATGSNLLFVACSGATTDHLGLGDMPKAKFAGLSPVNVHGGNTQLLDAQTFAAAGRPDLITVGVGGNDANFASIVGHCLFFDCATPRYAEGVINNIGQVVYGKLARAFQRLRDAFPGTTIAAFGYPRVIGDPDRGCAGLGIDVAGIGGVVPNERLWIRDSLVPALNGAIADAASRAGISFVDITRVTEGHEICTGEPWVNGLLLGDDIPFGVGPGASESVHPNQHGHDEVAQFFIKHYVDGAGRLIIENPAPQTPIRPPDGPTLNVGAVQAGAVEACGEACLRPVACVQACVIHLQGEGFAPRSSLRLTLHSDPVHLGSVTADASGAFVADLPLPAGVAPGLHAIEVSGTAPDGSEQTGLASIYVYATAPPPRRADPVPGVAAGGAPPAVRRRGARRVRAAIRVLGWRGRTLYVRLGCPRAAASACAVTLRLRAPATRRTKARTLATKRTIVRRGRSVTVALRRSRGRVSRRDLRLIAVTRTRAGARTQNMPLRAAKRLRRPPRVS